MSDYFQLQPKPDEIRENMRSFSSWFEVDLDSLGSNLKGIQKRVEVEVMAVVKNNAYGHGLLPVTAYLNEKGVNWFMVAKLYEALKIKEAGLDCNVLNMDALFSMKQFDQVVKHDIVQTVYRKDTADRLNELAEKQGKTAEVFVKVDTGLHRVGVKHTDAPELVEYIERLPHVHVKGIFSTFMQTPHRDRENLEKLLWVDGELRERGIEVEYRSMSSSDAVFHNPDGWLEMVRPGMSLYGVYPEDKDTVSGLDLKQALTFKARIEHTKWVEEGDSVTYWGRFIAPQRMKIGTLHVGFYDGIPREMANKGTIKVGEVYRRSLGSVSLNHYLLDLSDTDAKIGDTVEIIGKEGENSLAETAKTAGWMVYSLLNHLNPLIPRVYFKDNKPIAILEST